MKHNSDDYFALGVFTILLLIGALATVLEMLYLIPQDRRLYQYIALAHSDSLIG
jgi:hypothetical protein